MNTNPPDTMPENRRPLRSRDSRWAKKAAILLAAKGISPNQISLLSILFALLAGGCFLLTRGMSPLLPLILACVFVQLRLLCNLLDGMVAIEHGKQSRTGGFYNDFPDRIADILILFGFAWTILPHTVLPHTESILSNPAPFLGAANVVLALLTAYVRLLGASLHGTSDYSGPMAKQHRMAAVTLFSLLAAFSGSPESARLCLLLGNILIFLGTLLTVFRRSVRLLKKLEAE